MGRYHVFEIASPMPRLLLGSITVGRSSLGVFAAYMSEQVAKLALQLRISLRIHHHDCGLEADPRRGPLFPVPIRTPIRMRDS